MIETEIAALTEPAVTLNVAVVAPGGTVTLAGTLAAAALELESDITEPPAGAGSVSFTVPVEDCPLAIVWGTTPTLRSVVAGGSMVTPNVSFTPEYDAVKVTGVLFVTAPALTANVVETAPCEIATLDGNTAPAGDELSVIMAPPGGAGDVKATLQVAVDGGVIDTELQENPSRLSGKIVTVPPVVAVGSEEPEASAALLFTSCSGDDRSAVELDSPSNTEATMPLGIGAALGPDTTQVTEPELLLQKTVLFAAAAAGPAATVADEKSTVEYLSVHSTEAAESPVESFRPRFSATADPGLAEAEEMPRVTSCEKQTEHAAKARSPRRAVLDIDAG